MISGESTSIADKFDNFVSMKILNAPLTQKSDGIHTKRPEQEQNLQTKKGAISRPWRMNLVSRSIVTTKLSAFRCDRKGDLWAFGGDSRTPLNFAFVTMP